MVMNEAALRKLFLAVVLALAVITSEGCRSQGTPAVPPAEGRERRLRDIGKAISEYRRIHGGLSPVVSVPPGIQHSWRAIITPYFANDSWQPDYRVWEDWQSPHNRDALEDRRMQFYFSCPTEFFSFSRPFPYAFTSYLMLVRSSAESDPGTEGSLPPHAVLVVESGRCGIRFAEPRDLHWETLWQGDSPFGEGKLNSLHPGVVKALRVDGEVIDIPKDIGNDELRELLNGTGEEQYGRSLVGSR